MLGAGRTFVASAGADGARALLVSAEPIGEPVARRGPFVMNTEDEPDRAFAAYRAGRVVERVRHRVPHPRGEAHCDQR